MIALTATERMRWFLASHYFEMAAKPISSDGRRMACELVEWAFEGWDAGTVRQAYLSLIAESVGPEL